MNAVTLPGITAQAVGRLGQAPTALADAEFAGKVAMLRGRAMPCSPKTWR